MTVCPASPADDLALLDVQAVARLLDCSPRHIWRLVDGGAFPRPVPIGRLKRWPRTAVARWLADRLALSAGGRE